MVRRYAAALAGSLALHLLVAFLVTGTITPAPDVAAAKAPGSISVFTFAPVEDAAFPGLNPVAKDDRDWSVPAEDASLRIGDLWIDLARIGSRAQVLFPFLTPGLSFDQFLITPQRDLVAHLQNPFGSAPADADRTPVRPLELSDATLQAVVDKSWARRERWAAFAPLTRLTVAHDPDEGQLPALLRRYTDQNALQPYADPGSRDPRLWAQLGLAADHVLFIGFIRRYAAAHPSTRATTELLFLLDRVAEANCDALAVLLDSDPEEQLRWTRQANARAYWLLLQLRSYYRSELARRGLRTEADATVYYDKARLAILNGILRTTPGGYRANDARFRIGAILWGQGQTDAALRAWSEITANGDDGEALVSTEVAAALRRHGVRIGGAGPTVDPALRRDIAQILKNEHGRWLSFSDDRLRHFGHRFDSF